MYGTWRSSRMTSYASEVAWRCAEISGPIKKRESTGRVEKKMVRTGTWRESYDLRSRRKSLVLHIRRMMSFVSSFHRPAALNSLYLEFQEERPSYDDINTYSREIHPQGRSTPYLSRYHCGVPTSTLRVHCLLKVPRDR